MHRGPNLSVEENFPNIHDLFRTVILNWVLSSSRTSTRPGEHHITTSSCWIDGAPVSSNDDDDVVLQWL